MILGAVRAARERDLFACASALEYAKMDVLRKMSYQQNSHGCPVGCCGVRRTGSDVGANVSTKKRPPKPIYVNGAWSSSTMMLGTSKCDGTDCDL